MQVGQVCLFTDLQLCQLEPLHNKWNEGSLGWKKYLKVVSHPFSGILNEILCILVAKETAKLPEVKVGGLKNSSATFIFGVLTLTSGSFATPGATQMHSI